MAIPSETSVTFTELDILATLVSDITTALADAETALGLTTSPMIESTDDPDTDLTAACRDLILAEILEADLRAPIQTAFDSLRTALNLIVTGLDAGPIT